MSVNRHPVSSLTMPFTCTTCAHLYALLIVRIRSVHLCNVLQCPVRGLACTQVKCSSINAYLYLRRVSSNIKMAALSTVATAASYVQSATAAAGLPHDLLHIRLFVYAPIYIYSIANILAILGKCQGKQWGRIRSILLMHAPRCPHGDDEVSWGLSQASRPGGTVRCPRGSA